MMEFRPRVGLGSGLGDARVGEPRVFAEIVLATMFMVLTALALMVEPSSAGAQESPSCAQYGCEGGDADGSVAQDAETPSPDDGVATDAPAVYVPGTGSESSASASASVSASAPADETSPTREFVTEPVPEPDPEAVPAPVSETVPEPVPGPASAPSSAPASAPAPVPAPAAVSAPAPAASPAPSPASASAPASGEPEPVSEAPGGGVGPPSATGGAPGPEFGTPETTEPEATEPEATDPVTAPPSSETGVEDAESPPAGAVWEAPPAPEEDGIPGTVPEECRKGNGMFDRHCGLEDIPEGLDCYIFYGTAEGDVRGCAPVGSYYEADRKGTSTFMCSDELRLYDENGEFIGKASSCPEIRKRECGEDQCGEERAREGWGCRSERYDYGALYGGERETFIRCVHPKFEQFSTAPIKCEPPRRKIAALYDERGRVVESIACGKGGSNGGIGTWSGINANEADDAVHGEEPKPEVGGRDEPNRPGEGDGVDGLGNGDGEEPGTFALSVGMSGVGPDAVGQEAAEERNPGGQEQTPPSNAGPVAGARAAVIRAAGPLLEATRNGWSKRPPTSSSAAAEGVPVTVGLAVGRGIYGEYWPGVVAAGSETRVPHGGQPADGAAPGTPDGDDVDLGARAEAGEVSDPAAPVRAGGSRDSVTVSGGERGTHGGPRGAGESGSGQVPGRRVAGFEAANFVGSARLPAEDGAGPEGERVRTRRVEVEALGGVVGSSGTAAPPLAPAMLADVADLAKGVSPDWVRRSSFAGNGGSGQAPEGAFSGTLVALVPLAGIAAVGGALAVRRRFHG